MPWKGLTLFLIEYTFRRTIPAYAGMTNTRVGMTFWVGMTKIRVLACIGTTEDCMPAASSVHAIRCEACGSLKQLVPAETVAITLAKLAR